MPFHVKMALSPLPPAGTGQMHIATAKAKALTILNNAAKASPSKVSQTSSPGGGSDGSLDVAEQLNAQTRRKYVKGKQRKYAMLPHPAKCR